MSALCFYTEKGGTPRSQPPVQSFGGDLKMGENKEQRLRVPRLVRAVMRFSGPCGLGAKRSRKGV